MKTNYLAALLAALAESALVACGQSISEKAKSDHVAYVDQDDPAMTRAFEKARASLDEFFALVAAPKDGTTAYAVKVAVSDGKNTEYFWVNPFEVHGDTLSGVLNNEPETVMTYRMGERFTFTRDQVVDWTYMEPAVRRMHGNFTACALLEHEDPKEAEEFKQQYGLRCD